MSLSAVNVNVAITGAAYAAAAGATVTAPTTASSVLDTDLKDLGYLSEDGIEEQYSEDTTEIQAWQGGAVVRKVISSSEASFHFTMIENKREVVELFHKGSVMDDDGSTGWKIDVLTPNGERRAFVFDVVDGADIIRIYVPNGEVTERGSISYVGTDAIGYEVTVTAYPTNGVVCTKFSNKASWATA